MVLALVSVVLVYVLTLGDLRRFHGAAEQHGQLAALACALMALNGRRQWWVRPRTDDWAANWLMARADEATWVRMMGMRSDTFDMLLQHIEPHIARRDTNYRAAIPAYVRLGATLRFLRTGDSYVTLSALFGIGETTLGEIVPEVCGVIYRQLYHKLIGWPTDAAGTIRIMNAFAARAGLPNVVGAVDGVHIPVLMPACVTDRSLYIDRTGDTSVVFLAVCDADGRFLNVVGAMPGSTNDMRLMRNAALSRRSVARALTVGGMQGYLVGDSGFKLTSWCITPYDRRGGVVVSQSERRFNYRHSKTRVVIEHAFGQLKGRFRCLLKRLDCQPMHWVPIFMSCCILHNLCSMQREPFLNEWALGQGAWHQAFLAHEQARAVAFLHNDDGIAEMEEDEMVLHQNAFAGYVNLDALPGVGADAQQRRRDAIKSYVLAL